MGPEQNKPASQEAQINFVKGWLINDHRVTIVRYEYDQGGEQPFVAEQFECDCTPTGRPNNVCQAPKTARAQIADEAKRLNGQAWQAMGTEEAVSDIVRRVWQNGEWLGQYAWKLIYLQDLERLLDVPLSELDVLTYKMMHKGLLGKDGYTVFPGQQMQLIARDMHPDLRWYL